MKPEVVKQIEKFFDKGFELHLPKNKIDPLRGVMGAQKDYPKYALDEKGQLIGLNLAGVNLDNAKWLEILGLLEKHGVRLQALDLNENKLTEFSLSPSLANLSYLDIDDNPLESPPREIMKQGKDAVLRFLKDLLVQGTRELFEVKMLIVGEGETGKTTLWNLLQNPDHPVLGAEQKSTVGIQIREGWKFKHLDRPDVEFLVNLWDFGGQDIQYMTHQFFLTRRSFYVLLADGRREVANFPYWLDIIELLGCEPKVEKPLPVLVVLNEKGNPIAKMPYDPETVKKDYRKLNIIKREVDFGKKDDGRIEALTKTIQEILCHKIDHLPLAIPTFWDNVRQRLYSLRTSINPINHINAERLAQICEEEGITDKQQQDDLSQVLHDLGIILHFREDVHLADFIILNPQWAVNAVYEIMKHKEVKTVNQGRFDKELLQRVWTEKGFTAGEQANLLNLMLKDNLEVCFEATENRKTIFIAPQLLPELKPAGLEWKETPETLRYIYHYPFMPRGIIGRLIVRLNEDIETSGKEKVVWENGMIIQKDSCRAQVQFVDDKAQGRQIIKMEVQGESAEGRKNVLRDIRQQLDIIHRRSFPSLRFFQKVPCNCFKCESSVDPFEHDFYSLQENKKENGINAKSQCGKSFENVPVKKLLEGVFKEDDIALKTEFSQEQPLNSNTPNIVINKRPPVTGSKDATNIFFYVVALVIVAGILLVFLNSVGLWGALLGIAGMVILLVTLGALQLKHDKLLSGKSFVGLMGMILKKIPSLSWFSGKKNNDTDPS
jgi:internalin A